MKISKKLLTISAVAILATAGLGAGVAAAVTPPALPAEQQALINAGFTKNPHWAKFEKQNGACRITVTLSSSGYYVVSSGKRKASLYPVIPAQVVAGAALLDANCQG